MSSLLARALMEEPCTDGAPRARRAGEVSVERVLLATFWRSPRTRPSIEGAPVIPIARRATTPAND